MQAVLIKWIAEGTVAVSYLMLKFFKICKEQTSQETKKEVDEKQVNVVAFETPIKKSKKKPQKKKKKSMQYLRPKPNFFIGFPIYEAGIKWKVKKLQEEIIAKNPKLHSALVEISTLHVTLAVTHLANRKDIESIKEKLDDWAGKNETYFFKEPLTLSFTGIKTFSNIVAYLDIEPCSNKEKLLNLSKSINNLLSSAGFSIDKKGFTPHVTILKLTRSGKLLKARKSFHDDFEFLKNCKEHFGKQDICTLQLLSMDDPKDEKGYYKCLHEIFVKDPKIEEDQSDRCSPIPKHAKLASEED